MWEWWLNEVAEPLDDWLSEPLTPVEWVFEAVFAGTVAIWLISVGVVVGAGG